MTVHELAVVLAIATLGGCKPSAPAAAAPLVCAGQLPGSTASARGGAMETQLSPGFLDKMAACDVARATIPAGQVSADAGTVNDKGDCAWTNGVVCHFHRGVEFVASTDTPRPALAELHCIFPVDGEPKSPRVFGTHFTCKAGTTMPATKQPAAGAACGAGLLSALAARSATPACGARCCEDGTLTNPAADRAKLGKLDIRPDFRICATTDDDLDCAALATMVGHPANAPIFGAPIEAAF